MDYHLWQFFSRDRLLVIAYLEQVSQDYGVYKAHLYNQYFQKQVAQILAPTQNHEPIQHQHHLTFPIVTDFIAMMMSQCFSICFL